MTVILFYTYLFILAGMGSIFSYGDHARDGVILFFVGVSYLGFYSGILGPGVAQ